MDDFYIIAQETNSNKDNTLDTTTSSETQVKSLTKFLRNITGGTASSSISNNSPVGNAASSAPNLASSNSNQTVQYMLNEAYMLTM